MSSLSIYVVSRNCSEQSPAYLIFDAHEASALRSSTFRVFPNFIGTRFKENNVGTSSEESLPLQLTETEVCNLIETYQCVNLFESIGYDDLIWSREDYEKFTADMNAYEDGFNERQKDEFRFKRVNELLRIKDQILDGKRAKLNRKLSEIEKSFQVKNIQDEDNLKIQRDQLLKDLENLEIEFEKEIETVKASVSQETNNVEIFLKTPKFYEALFKVRTIGRDEFTLRMHHVYASCKYHAYKYFWTRGYYLTGGAKFGGDFLVYPGEPSRYHSQFILVCVDPEANMDQFDNFKQLITYARMATSVKKTFVLACLFDKQKQKQQQNQRLFLVDLDDRFQFGLISLNWSHI